MRPNGRSRCAYVQCCTPFTVIYTKAKRNSKLIKPLETECCGNNGKPSKCNHTEKHCMMSSNSVVYKGFPGWGAMEGVVFSIGEVKNFAFFKIENFQKMLKN